MDLAGPTRERFRAAAQAGPPDPRARLLAALAPARGPDRRLLPGHGHRAVRRERRRPVRAEWHAVERAAREDKAAAGGGRFPSSNSRRPPEGRAGRRPVRTLGAPGGGRQAGVRRRDLASVGKLTSADRPARC
ncbi:hypothetical protein [Streptomyces sp. CT34]|uniref:hypothetical protein n=1 Tax=Streptomyces sp. CT34 TaxID=1553907 RepID=UPI0006914F90|nr:hypothetical protein [Streptomyces sp. CT34]